MMYVSICLHAMTLTPLNKRVVIWHYTHTAQGSVTQGLSDPYYG